MAQVRRQDDAINQSFQKIYSKQFKRIQLTLRQAIYKIKTNNIVA